MLKFKAFLEENDNTIHTIYTTLDTMTPDELDEFGFVLHTEFFDSDEEITDDELDEFTIDDIKEMIGLLGAEYYEDVLFLLQLDDEDYAEDIEFDEESKVYENEQLSEDKNRASVKLKNRLAYKKMMRTSKGIKLKKIRKINRNLSKKGSKVRVGMDRSHHTLASVVNKAAERKRMKLKLRNRMKVQS